MTKNKIKRKSPNKLTSLALAGAVLGFGIYYFDLQLEKKTKSLTLEEARREPKKRQRYLEQLVRDKIPYCSGVVYDNDGTKITEYVLSEAKRVEKSKSELSRIKDTYLNQFNGGNYDAKTPEVLELSALKENSKIFLGRELFENPIYESWTDEDIKFIISCHEARHCEQHALGLGLVENKVFIEGAKQEIIEGKVLYSLFEYDANAYALKSALNGRFNLSHNYLNLAKSNFINHGFALTLASAKTNSSQLQRELIEKLHKRVYQEPLLRDVRIGN